MNKNQLHFQIRSVYFYAVLLVSLWSVEDTFAQDTERPNTIQTRLFPTYNSDFSYFFMRRDMKMYEQMTSAETIIHEDGAADIRTKLFIPIHKSDKWSYSIPIYFDRYQFIGESENQKLNVNNLFGQSLLTYHPNSNWDFSHIIEFRFKGADNYFIENEGNWMAQFITAQYNLNNEFSFIGGSLMGIGWNNENDTYFGIKPAFMLKWKPNKYLNLMVGMPASAIEWSAPGGIDLMAHTLLDGSEWNTSAAIRKNMGNHFDITFRYLHEGFDELYTPYQAIGFEVPSANFEQIGQYQDKYQVELTLRPEANTIVQLIGGYAQNRDLILINNGDNEVLISSSNGFYFGVNLARAIILQNNFN
jgi:hypothetical protein